MWSARAKVGSSSPPEDVPHDQQTSNESSTFARHLGQVHMGGSSGHQAHPAPSHIHTRQSAEPNTSRDSERLPERQERPPFPIIPLVPSGIAPELYPVAPSARVYLRTLWARATRS